MIYSLLFSLLFEACGDNVSSANDQDATEVSSSSIIPGSSNSEIVANSSSSRDGEGDVIPSSSSAEETESSEEPAEVKTDGYYKTNCPIGHICTYVTTEYLNSSKTYGEFLDTRDYQVYKTIEICDDKNENCQVWMTQNLNYNPGEVSDVGNYAWHGCYDNNDANCTIYGRLYTWEIAMNESGCSIGNDCENAHEGNQGVCPSGWHLPSLAEWNALIAVVGINSAGHNLKASGWNGADTYGFSVLPAGYYDGLYDKFDHVGDEASLWSSTESEYITAYNMSFDSGEYIDEDMRGVDVDLRTKTYGFSVRCLLDSN